MNYIITLAYLDIYEELSSKPVWRIMSLCKFSYQTGHLLWNLYIKKY